MAIENVALSAVTRFVESQQYADLVDGGFIGEDGDTPWVFQGSDDDRPFRDPQGAGKGAVVFTVNDTWAVNQHNTAEFPLLTALVYMDVSRDGEGAPMGKDGKVRALYVVRLIKEVFHDAANKVHTWPNGIYVHSCVAQSGISVLPVPEGDGMHRAAVRFEVATN